MRLTKGFMAIFAPAESLPSPATLDLCNYLSTQGNDFKSHKRNHNGETTTVEKHDPESARIGERLKTSAVQLSANSAMYKGTTLWFVCSSGKKHNFRTCGEGRAH